MKIITWAIVGWLTLGVLVQVKDFLWNWKRVQKHYFRDVIRELFFIACLATVFPVLFVKLEDKDHRFPERKDFE
jgi:hypothetical protein